MYFTPHIIQKRVEPLESCDEYGRPVIANPLAPTWEYVCRGRCDNSGDKEVRMPDGNISKPGYHAVLEGNRQSLKVGDYVRCLLSDSETDIAEGRIVQFKSLNVLPYAEIYF